MHAFAMSEDQHRPLVLASFLKLALFTGGACFLFLVVLSLYLAKILHADSIWPITWVVFLLLVNIILATFYGDLQGNNLYLFFSSTKVVGSLLVLMLGLTLIKMGSGASGAIAGYAGSMGLLTIFFFTRRKFFSFRKGLYSFVLPFYSLTISKQNDPRMLFKAVILTFSFGSTFIAIGLFSPKWFFQILYGRDFVTASSYMALFAFTILMHMISIVVLFHEATKETFSFGLLLIPVVLTASLTIFPNLTIWVIIVFHNLSWSIYFGCLAGHRLLVAPVSFSTTQLPPARSGLILNAA